MKHVFWLIMILSAAVAQAQEQTSKNTPLLQRALQRFPDADQNRDGVLTRAEAEKYRQQVLGGKAKVNPSAGRAAKKAAGKARRNPIPTSAPAPTFENVQYGPHARNVMDFWKAGSDKPAPVLVCVHGGGFVAGDKKKFRTDPLVSDCLKHGISVAAINYRYVTAAPFPAPMHDGARAVQFLRSKAQEWNLDPKRIGASGGSAGANLMLWVACHDDLAQKDSPDPVARQSTRLALFVGNGTQTFNDPGLIHQFIYAGNGIHTSFRPFFGIRDNAEIGSERVKKLGYEASAINFASKDDPPVYLAYNGSIKGAPFPNGTNQGTYIHHARFGELFKAKYDALGLECVLHYLEKPARAGEPLEFILKHFGVK